MAGGGSDDGGKERGEGFRELGADGGGGEAGVVEGAGGSVAAWQVGGGGGPGGDGGGEIVAVGTPEAVAAQPASWTGRYLKDVLERHEQRRLARRKSA
ncbi:MAG: hypothetical protein Q7V15_12200 [Phenylobacterium sp.]|nr:hypothetical protein [Phenylobacterium sp.]MDO8902106.1 hypothetical protein [Phenylobacterium sp.]